MSDEYEAPLESSIHHRDEAGPLATSSQQPAASISTSHDHEQDGPLSIKVAPLTEHASTSTAYIDVVLPPADPSISISHDHEQPRPSTIEAAPLTEQASTSTAIDVVIPPADP